MLYIMAAIINLLVGLFYIDMGIKREGKKGFYRDIGWYYIGWVALSTTGLLTKGIISLNI